MIYAHIGNHKELPKINLSKFDTKTQIMKPTLKELQDEKISIVKEIANTSCYSISRHTELHCEYDRITKDEMICLLENSGIIINDNRIIDAMTQAFALGKKEQASYYYEGIVK